MKPIDQFDVYNALVRSQRGWLFRELLPYIVAAIGALFFIAATFRPLPVVVVDEKPTGMFALDDTSVRELDVKRFMVRASRLLHGWNSVTVLDDLTQARKLMTVDQAGKFTAELQATVDTPTGKTPLLNSYITARVSNRIEFDFESLSCRKLKTEWECRLDVDLFASPIFSDDKKVETPARVFRLTAKFIEVPIALDSLDGLLISSWAAKERF